MNWLEKMSCLIWYVLDRIWPPLVAVFLTLTFIRLRMPKLKISPGGMTPILDGKFYAWRFVVQNTKSMRWLPLRETATNCHAKIEFLKGIKSMFIMKGRWVESSEIPHFANADQLR